MPAIPCRSVSTRAGFCSIRRRDMSDPKPSPVPPPEAALPGDAGQLTAVAASEEPGTKNAGRRRGRPGSIRGMLRSPLAWVTGIVVIWFAAAFLVLPNAALLGTTFFPEGEFSLRAIEKLLGSERAMKTLGNSF